jgi:hypothetical protein
MFEAQCDFFELGCIDGEDVLEPAEFLVKLRR